MVFPQAEVLRKVKGYVLFSIFFLFCLISYVIGRSLSFFGNFGEQSEMGIKEFFLDLIDNSAII